MRIPKWALIILFIAALVGFADSSYLTAEHVRGAVPPCTGAGCDTVLTSTYANVGPLPLAAFGMVYYGALLVLLIAYLDVGSRRIVHAFAWIVSIGMLLSLYFVVVQLFILHAICPYCMASAAVTTVMFGIAIYLVRKC
ncbi:MAG TPA: vitamin K epoxide reductase family protein [Candidatus Paceibacterota bacterium]|nr:vitamin K epoxide reductase family protein [Candidatus Paceibacterota bacterium]